LLRQIDQTLLHKVANAPNNTGVYNPTIRFRLYKERIASAFPNSTRVLPYSMVKVLRIRKLGKIS